MNLGTHSPADFSGVGSATPWVDSTINITCSGSFHGNEIYDETNFTLNDDSSGWVTSNVQLNEHASKNTPFLRIYPVHGYIADGDDVNMISLQDTEGSATGIGIQLGDANGSPLNREIFDYITEFDTNAMTAYTHVEIGASSFTVPLYSRYIQTEENITPGSANSQVTYTLNYRSISVFYQKEWTVFLYFWTIAATYFFRKVCCRMLLIFSNNFMVLRWLCALLFCASPGVQGWSRYNNRRSSILCLQCH